MTPNFELWLAAYLSVRDNRAALNVLDHSRRRALNCQYAATPLGGLEREVEERLRATSLLSGEDVLRLLIYVTRQQAIALSGMPPERDWPLKISLNRRTYIGFKEAEWIYRRPTVKNQFSGIPAAGPVLGNEDLSGISVHWEPADGWPKIDFRAERSLEMDSSTLKVGVVSWLTWKDMAWSSVPDDSGEKLPWYRRQQTRATSAARERLCEIVQEAIVKGVEILLFPELTICDNLIQVLAEELQRSPESPIRLVVAGSHHEVLADSLPPIYVNRSRILSGLGVELWYQDKMELYKKMGKSEAERAKEPTKMGDSLIVRESGTLGRLAVLICSDFCNTAGAFDFPHWRALQTLRPSLVLVPTMQVDGELSNFLLGAEKLRKEGWGASVGANVRVRERDLHAAKASSYEPEVDDPEKLDDNPSRFSGFYWTADCRMGHDAITINSTKTDGYMKIIELQRISSQGLVNYKRQA